ncbi:MAG: peptide MFS transporter [Candidatus Krumholzibacteria bacterium]|nr:peptide MFS transporter [Candidatus Krumholzibacteria bacterium]
MSSVTVPEKTWLGHPRGLSTLFFTELWERFSYYGMRGILILFMTNETINGGMAMSTVTAGAIYGLYTAAVYLVALPGGWIADRLMGQRRAIFTGGVIIAAGHFTLAIHATAAFYLGLILIVIGTGFLKPNVSAIVGGLYPEGGSRRDAGFSIFYMGINIGAFAGPLVCGYLGENINWHYGFGAAGVGMVLGLIQYKIGYKYLRDVGLPPQNDTASQSQARRRLIGGISSIVVIGAVLALVRVTGLWAYTLDEFARGLGGFVILLAVAYFLYVLTFGKLDNAAKKRVIVIFFLFIGAALFWSGFEQAGSSMNLFAEQLTNRVVFGFESPASWLQSVNPLFIILLAPVFGWLWLVLGTRAPSIPVKFGLGLGLLGIGFLVMAWGASFTGSGPGVSPMWLVVTYFLHTTGELCLSPVGLSSITKLSPKHLVGQMMGIWFMGSALGNLFAGLIGGQFEALPLTKLFMAVALVAIGSGFLFLVFSKPIRKLIGGPL